MSSAAEGRSWTGWRVGSTAYTHLQNTCNLLPVTDVWGPPQYLETGRAQMKPERFVVWHRMCVCVLACVTIDSKDIFDLLLYDFQSHFNPIGPCHGMDLVGVQSVDVQDLEEKICKLYINFSFNLLFVWLNHKYLHEIKIGRRGNDRWNCICSTTCLWGENVTWQNIFVSVLNFGLLQALPRSCNFS